MEMIDGQPVLDALEKISSCPPFATADSLRNLLTYLVKQTIENPGEPIKEAQIASAVFNKTEGFDPRQDSTVRVQSSRLRSKLTEYYLGAGAKDAWILEVPKGSYSVTAKQRDIEPIVEIDQPVERKPLSPWLYAAGGFLAGVLATWLYLRV